MAHNHEDGERIPVPKEVREKMEAMFGKDIQILDMFREQQRHFKEEPEAIPARPLTMKQAQWLLNSDWIPFAGDIVTLREDMPFSNDYMKWPIMGENCVVTRVIPEAQWGNIHDEHGGTFQLGSIVLAWAHKCGDGDCMIEGALTEYRHDHRIFRLVGNINDDTTKIGRPLVPGGQIE